MKNKGFSLIEISIVVFVVSVVAASSLSLLAKKNNAKDNKGTKGKLEFISRALQVYYNNNGYLPCPAKFDAKVKQNDPIAGDYLVGEAVEPGCGGANVIPGIRRSTQADESDIVGGVVPYIDLGIEPSYMFDEWGRRITYIVDRQMATDEATFNSSTAHIEVKNPTQHAIKRKPKSSEIGTNVEDCTDESGVTSINAANFSVEIPICMAYAIISHGPNGQWGIKSKGQGHVVHQSGYGTYEWENSLIDVSGSGIFNDVVINMPVNVGATNNVSAGFFDDIIIHREKEYLINEKARSANIQNN